MNDQPEDAIAGLDDDGGPGTEVRAAVGQVLWRNLRHAAC